MHPEPFHIGGLQGFKQIIYKKLCTCVELFRNKFKFNGICMCCYPGSYPKQVGQYPAMQPSPAYPTQPQQMQYQPPGQYGAPGQAYGVPPPPYSETPSQPAPSGMYNVSYQQM